MMSHRVVRGELYGEVTGGGGVEGQVERTGGGAGLSRQVGAQRCRIQRQVRDGGGHGHTTHCLQPQRQVGRVHPGGAHRPRVHQRACLRVRAPRRVQRVRVAEVRGTQTPWQRCCHVSRCILRVGTLPACQSAVANLAGGTCAAQSPPPQRACAGAWPDTRARVGCTCRAPWCCGGPSCETVPGAFACGSTSPQLTEIVNLVTGCPREVATANTR